MDSQTLTTVERTAGARFAPRSVRRRRANAKDRKDKVEQVLKQARKIDGDPNETRQAWCRIIRELEFLCDPEAKMPRFNALLHAVWIAATGDQT